MIFYNQFLDNFYDKNNKERTRKIDRVKHMSKRERDV